MKPFSKEVLKELENHIQTDNVEEFFHQFRKNLIDDTKFGSPFYVSSYFRDLHPKYPNFFLKFFPFIDQKQNDEVAVFLVATCFLFGFGTHVDQNKSFELFSKNSSHSGSIISLGFCYQNGYGVFRDLNKAAQLYREAADFHDSRGQFNLGYCYEHGLGVDEDLVSASHYYKLAANANNTNAIINLSILKTKKAKFLKSNVLLKKGMELENARCYYFYAQHLAAGHGMKRDLDQSLYYYQVAAELNDSFSFFEYGFLLFHLKKPGYSTQFKKAVLVGARQSFLWYGICLIEGLEVEKQFSQGLDLVSQSLDFGDSFSQLYSSFISKSTKCSF